MIKKVNLLILFLGVLILGFKGQVISSPTKAYVNVELPNASAPNNHLQVSTNLIVEDIDVVAKIRIKLGTTFGGGDLLTHTYINNSTDLIISNSINGTDEMITINLGNHPNSGTFYCEIILEDSFGNLSEPFNCQSNQ
jgi:hypothetical protein